MPIRCDEYDGICVIAAEQEFAGDDASQARDQVEKMFDREIVNFVIDFEKCGFVDSAGLETLTWLQDRCEAVYGRLSLAAAKDNVEKILTLTRLRGRFDIADDVNVALKRMR